jgi:prevent-host-death family protein
MCTQWLGDGDIRGGARIEGDGGGLGGPPGSVLYVDIHNCTIREVSRTMTVSEARASLAEVLDRVLAGEEVTVTRHGKAVAVIVRPDALRVRRADEALAAADRLRDLLAEGRNSPLRTRPRLSQREGELLLAEVRSARSSR